MVGQSKWANALVEYIAVCRVITKAEVSAVTKLMLNQTLTKKDAYALLWMLETHPTTRLDRLDLEDFQSFVEQHSDIQLKIGGA